MWSKKTFLPEIFSAETKYEPLNANQAEDLSFSSTTNSSGGRCQKNKRLLTCLFIFGGFSLIYLVTLHSEKLQAHLYRSVNRFTGKEIEIVTNSPKQNNIIKTLNLLENLHLDYLQLLQNQSSRLFLLEPHLLTLLAEEKGNSSYYDAEEYRWRFGLPPAFRYRQNSLTVGIFAENIPENGTLDLSFLNFTEQTQITGSYGPFNASSNSTNSFLHHAFYQKISPATSTPLHLHLVVLYRVRQLFWIGSIKEDILFLLNDGDEENAARTTIVHFGRWEEVYDPFELQLDETHNISTPSDLPHLLSQLPTSRYLHCDPAKTTTWFSTYNQTQNSGKAEASKRAIVRMKSFMRQMKMQFWAVCGTLLGWYRQCTVTPYTTDTDFASWSKYVRAEPIDPEVYASKSKESALTKRLQEEAPKHELYILNRFGESQHSLEYSFATTGSSWEKADLFFIYPNRTHFLLPFHVPPQFAYSVYPRYGLCSAELMGVKVNVPCDPLAVILAEYGTDWQKPISSWSYYQAPKNIGPARPFKFGNVTQHATF